MKQGRNIIPTCECVVLFSLYVLIVSIELHYVSSIQKYMSCKGACLASVGTDQPAEVVYDAPKYLVIIYFMI